jgi:hypothetical protein
MSRDFYELCYDQYKQEMTEAGSLYQTAGFMLAAIPLLGAIMVTLGRTDVLHLSFARVDTFLFYLAFVLATAALIASVVFLFLCVYPRRYKTLASMDVWQKWREDYQKYLDAKADGAENGESLDMAMFTNLCPRLAEAQPINAEINERRRKAFKRSVQMAAIALVAVGAESLFGLIMKLQGV